MRDEPWVPRYPEQEEKLATLQQDDLGHTQERNDSSDDEMKNFIDKRNKAISDKLISAMESNRKETQ